jgi:drug/metabolite transporter superfamily protein YnfA
VLFVLVAVAEIGGAWRVWQGVGEHRGLVFVGAGIVALGLYGLWDRTTLTDSRGRSQGGP